MRLQLIELTCASCSGLFELPALLSGAYAEFILRSDETFELAYLNALEDAAFNEVYEILKGHPTMQSERDEFIADVLHRIYGLVACDTDSLGYPFGIEHMPPCPLCAGRGIAHWEAIEPPAFVDVAVKPVTHTSWDKLSADQRIRNIENELVFLGDSRHAPR